MCCRKVSIAEVWRCVSVGKRAESHELMFSLPAPVSALRVRGGRGASVTPQPDWLRRALLKHFDCTVEEWTLLRVQESLNWSYSTKNELTSHEWEPASRERERKVLAPHFKTVLAKLQQNQFREILNFFAKLEHHWRFKVHFILALERVCRKSEIYLDVFGNLSSNTLLFLFWCCFLVTYLNKFTGTFGNAILCVCRRKRAFYVLIKIKLTILHTPEYLRGSAVHPTSFYWFGCTSTLKPNIVLMD